MDEHVSLTQGMSRSALARRVVEAERKAANSSRVAVAEVDARLRLDARLADVEAECQSLRRRVLALEGDLLRSMSRRQRRRFKAGRE